MKLYHCRNSRSLRVLWALEELGLPYELEVMAFPPRVAVPGYLEVNPLGTVPTFVDGDLTLTESTAICHYLAEKAAPNDLRVDPSEREYGSYLNWLYRSDATLTFPQTIVLRYTALESEERRLPQAAEDYTIWFFARLRSVEAALEGRDYLCAGRFTIADIAVHFALLLGDQLGLSARYKRNTRRYFEALMQRPAFRRALERERASGQ